MPPMKNWNRQEAIENKKKPYIWQHAVDDTLYLQVETPDHNPRKNPPFYNIVLRRQYTDEPIGDLGSRKKKTEAYDAAKKWADNHPNPKEAQKEPFLN